jgi:putative ABC transport system permease protein
MGARFLLRWSARDLRRRWLQVAAIALILAIGTGLFAGLGGTATWRRQSNDASFALLGMYDVRVRTATGADADAGALRSVLDALPDPAIVDTAEERLVLPTQVDASTGDDTILVPGRIVGLDVASGGPALTSLWVESGHGRSLEATDDGRPTAVLERSFATFYDLPAAGHIQVSGGQPVDYVGTGTGPEYFIVMAEEGGFFAQANFAAVFTSLATAQTLTGRPGRVNDLVIRLRPGADRAAAETAIEAAFRTARPDLGVTVMNRDDEDAYRILYDDIKGDQKFWNVFAALILLGAGLGAFNLASRMVDAQRREIGIAMALGDRPWHIAARPLLVGAEIAAAGTVLGIGVGLLAVEMLRPVYTTMLPMPVWHTDLQWATFVRGAALGFVIPLVATAWPVVRAVRMTPVDAIATTHRAGHDGLAGVIRRLPRPASALRRMPIGNVLRTPRRTILTATGIGAAVTTLVALLGMLDSFVTTMERSERELLHDERDRMVVTLDGFLAEDDARVQAIAGASSVGAVEPVLRVPATVGDIDLLLEIVDMGSDVWAPTVEHGTAAGPRSGLVLSAKAADDLGVEPGDRVVVEHPARTAAGIAMVRSEMTVAGIHPGPFRFNAYLDRSHLPAFGAAGVVNELFVLPAAGHTTDDVSRQLFGLDGVSSVQPVAIATQIMRDSLDDYTGVFRAMEAFVLALVLLMAYNAASINADERARERATLFAFGLPTRRLLRLESAEGFIIGVLGSAVGLAGGLAVVRWFTRTVAATTMPDVRLDVHLTPSTIVTTAVLGTAMVALAPLLTTRRLRRMDIPGTLRVVE